MDEGNAGATSAGAEGACAVAPPVAKAAVRRKARKRAVGFSKKRAKVFLAMLGEVANVAQACRASGLSDSTVYRRRRSDADFRAEWQEALREGVARLEAELLDRALNGVEKVVWHGGKKVGSVRHYNDALALALLRVHGPGVGREAPAPAPAREQQGIELAEWLGEMNRRMGGAG